TPEELKEWAQEEPQRLLEASLAQVVSLQKRAQQLRAARQEIKAKDARIAQLETLLESAQKASFRQAAPFRVAQEKRSLAPKRPGRKAGHPGACRPRPAQIDEEINAPLGGCPQCGHRQWCDQQEFEQFIEEIPVVRPHVTRLRTYEATCACCGETTSSHHPLQVSQATGAAAAHLGPRALAIAADLNKAKGLTMRKTCAVLHDHFGLRLTAGGLAQALSRVAARVLPQYVELGEKLLQAPAVHVDETSWWVAGSLWWLWVFTHPLGTFYRVDKSRGRGVLEGVLGAAFPGVLISDCLSVYDLESGVQQKCYAHHLKAIRNAKEIHPEKGQGFLTQIGALLKGALTLGQEQTASPAPEAQALLLQQRQQLEIQAEALLALPRQQVNEESVRNRLFKQKDHLFTFLQHPGVDATNNLAERQLRPAVIARKISCGNKTAGGAETFQILASLAATATQIGSSFIDLIAKAMPFNSS
ncbi:MAG TPA: IS66 family transposase, partial [Terriglobales bacterium]|nr:IS66 family transposase [Terriglobales bacterium]